MYEPELSLADKFEDIVSPRNLGAGFDDLVEDLCPGGHIEYDGEDWVLEGGRDDSVNGL